MTPAELDLPPLPPKYRWQVDADPHSHPMIRLQRRRRRRWRTVGFSYVLAHYARPSTFTPADVGRLLYQEHLARRAVGLD